MIIAAKCTDIGGREINEDRCGIFWSGETLCTAVADGLGGHGGGGEAASMAVDILEKQFLQMGADGPVPFGDWFQSINESIYQAQTKECKMKTTLAALWTNGAQYLLAHVGDTRIYHFREGHLASVTFDHSVSQMAVLRGEITQQEIRHHVDRNRLLRALGTEECVRTEVSGPIEITGGRHAFLLCTDGFWEYVLESDMEETLQSAGTPDQWLELMHEQILQRVAGSNDNHTAVAVWIDNS
ncbi:MAG: protein phosphatase 2C domain-containing protein [bacterium]|nr:protein phosphatase 2C domain-containing protein [bacterium]